MNQELLQAVKVGLRLEYLEIIRRERVNIKTLIACTIGFLLIECLFALSQYAIVQRLEIECNTMGWSFGILLFTAFSLVIVLSISYDTFISCGGILFVFVVAGFVFLFFIVVGNIFGDLLADTTGWGMWNAPMCEAKSFWHPLLTTYFTMIGPFVFVVWKFFPREPVLKQHCRHCGQYTVHTRSSLGYDYVVGMVLETSKWEIVTTCKNCGAYTKEKIYNTGYVGGREESSIFVPGREDKRAK